MTRIPQLKQAAYFIICLLIINASCNIDQAKAEKTKNTKPTSVKLEVTSHLGDHQNFIENDIISFLISLDRSAYLYAFYRDAEGHIVQLMPGIANQKHFYKAGLYQSFPPKHSKFRFVVQEPFGKEQLWLFASDNSELKFKHKITSQGLKQIKLNYKELSKTIRTSSSGLFGASRLEINTQRKTKWY